MNDNMQTLDEIEEELAIVQNSQHPAPPGIPKPTYSVSLGSVRKRASHHYMQGYINALKWVLRDGKERK